MQRTWKRRQFVVDWRLQGSLCLHALLYGGLVLAAFFGGIYGPLLWDLGRSPDALKYEEQAIVMLWMHDRIWLLMLLCAVIVVVSALKFSHRIAGPLVRYKRNLRLLADGALPPPLRTRPGDYLQEEVACLNAAVAGVAARVAAIRAAQAEVAAGVAALTAGGSDDPRFAALATASHELARSVAAFTAVDPGDAARGTVPVAAVATLALAGNPGQ